MGEVPNRLPVLAVPAAPAGVPPLRAMREPQYVYPIPVDRGKEVEYENLVPGTHYYIQRGEGLPMDEFILVELLPERHGLRARVMPRLLSIRNREGNPLPPVYEPGAPGPLANAVFELHVWPHYRFFEVNKIKRTGRFLDPVITVRAKRQAVMNSLSKKGLPSVVGTGPANLVLGFAGLRPPRKTKGGKRKHRKTRKHRRT